MSFQNQIAGFSRDYPVQGFTDARGAAWGYRKVGSGANALLALPGASGTSEFFFSTAEALSRDSTVYLIDYPGMPGPDDLAEGFLGLWDALGVGNARLLGSSYAAYWLQIVAHRRPQATDALVLSNGFTCSEDLAGNPLFDRAAIDQTSAEQLQAEWLERSLANPNPVLGRLLERAMRGGLPAQDLKGRLLSVSGSLPIEPAPLPAKRMLILDCEDDAIITPDARQRLRDRYASATHITIRGGHYPYVTEPQNYVLTVNSFLE